MTQAFLDLLQGISNPYLDFIDICRKKQYSKETFLYVHHIVPRFHYKKHALDTSTFDKPNNKVTLSYKDHVHAHELRYQVYKEAGDKAALLTMSGLTEDGFRAMLRAGAEATNELMKRQGRTVFNINWQKEMGRRSMALPNALETRSKGGKTSMKNQNTGRIIRKEQRHLWSYNGQPFLCTFNFDLTSELLLLLNKAKPSKLKRISPLLKGTRRTAYGWSVQEIT